MLSVFKYLPQILLMLSQKILEVTDSFICGNAIWVLIMPQYWAIYPEKDFFQCGENIFIRLKMISQN